MRTFAPLRPIPAKLARATSSASGETSVNHTVVPTNGNSWANDNPIAPEPVPMSTTTRLGCTARAASSATSATSSVSGRGMSTRASTNKSKWRNAQRPITYCNGSPARRRRTISCTYPPMRCDTTSPSALVNSAASKPAACSHKNRASCLLPSVAWVSASNSRQVVPASVVTRCRPAWQVVRLGTQE